jgi:hypothetical protein
VKFKVFSIPGTGVGRGHRGFLVESELEVHRTFVVQRAGEPRHRNWTKNRDCLPSSTVGKLADIDPSLIVTAPRRLESGYVSDCHTAGSERIDKSTNVKNAAPNL